MEIIRQMQERNDLTERERNIRDYLMEHPEAVIAMTAKQLGEVSYSSTAAVSRFCRKIGCQDYGEFRLRFQVNCRVRRVDRRRPQSIL